jgi:hypothetical protein
MSVKADLTATDGQTLGYPWIGFVQNLHAQPFLGFSGDVWESGGGPILPVTATNVASFTEWLAPVARSSLLRELQERSPGKMPERPQGQGTTRRLGVTPDAVEAHGIDVSWFLSPEGTGIVSATVEPVEVLPGSAAIEGSPDRRDEISELLTRRRALVQVTNLGISVKDSAQSTLIFVTRPSR